MICILRSCWVFNEFVPGFDIIVYNKRDLIEKARTWCPERIERIA